MGDLEDDGFVTLTYRELAAELGISLSAARTRVRRAVAAGRWRLVPGNRPGTPSYVQVPEREMSELRRQAAAPAVRNPAANPGEAVSSGRGSDDLVIETLNSTYRHIERLHRVALNEKDERRLVELRLVVAERNGHQLQGEVTRLEDWGRQLDVKVACETAEKARLMAQVAQLRATERQYRERIEEQHARIEQLRTLLRKARRPWWKRLFYKPLD